MVNKSNNIIRIGTRGSPLALWQAKQVNNKLTEGKITTTKNVEDENKYSYTIAEQSRNFSFKKFFISS